MLAIIPITIKTTYMTRQIRSPCGVALDLYQRQVICEFSHPFPFNLFLLCATDMLLFLFHTLKRERINCTAHDLRIANVQFLLSLFNNVPLTLKHTRADNSRMFDWLHMRQLYQTIARLQHSAYPHVLTNTAFVSCCTEAISSIGLTEPYFSSGRYPQVD